MLLVEIMLGISIVLCILYMTVIPKFCQGKAMDLFGVHGAHVFRMFCFFVTIGFTWVSLMIWFNWVQGGGN